MPSFSAHAFTLLPSISRAAVLPGSVAGFAFGFAPPPARFAAVLLPPRWLRSRTVPATAVAARFAWMRTQLPTRHVTTRFPTTTRHVAVVPFADRFRIHTALRARNARCHCITRGSFPAVFALRPGHTHAAAAPYLPTPVRFRVTACAHPRGLPFTAGCALWFFRCRCCTAFVSSPLCVLLVMPSLPPHITLRVHPRGLRVAQFERAPTHAICLRLLRCVAILISCCGYPRLPLPFTFDLRCRALRFAAFVCRGYAVAWLIVCALPGAVFLRALRVCRSVLRLRAILRSIVAVTHALRVVTCGLHADRLIGAHTALHTPALRVASAARLRLRLFFTFVDLPAVPRCSAAFCTARVLPLPAFCVLRYVMEFVTAAFYVAARCCDRVLLLRCRFLPLRTLRVLVDQHV